MLIAEQFSRALRPYKLIAIYLAVVAFVAAFCVHITVSPYASAAAMVLLIFVVIAAKAGSSFASLTLLYVVLLVLAQFLKRAVFIFGGQQPQSQYIVLAIPSVVLLYLLIRTFWEGAHKKLDAVSIVFLLFIAVLLANTWLMARRGIMESVLATGRMIFPMMAFFVFRKAAEDSRFIDRFCLTIVVLGAVMAPYGVLQFLCGPGPIETAWAEASYGFSIQATKVRNFLAGAYGRPYMRAFSTFTDNFSFGFFEAAALVALVICRLRNRLSGSVTPFLAALLLAGLISSYARASWFALIVCMVFFFCAFAIRRLSTIVLFTTLVVAYLLVTHLAGWASKQPFPAQGSSDPYVSGAFNVGTLRARAKALPALVNIIKDHPITGYGAGGSYFVSAKLTGSLTQARNPVDDRHNYFGNLVWKGGLPVLLLFLSFVYLVVAKGRSQLLARDPVVVKTYSLMLGFVIAMFLASAFCHDPCHQGFFLAWCAFICGSRICEKCIGSEVRSLERL